MGKRELVLISVFVALGIVVYQFTAPPPPPGSEGVSIGGIFRNLRHGVQGARESATADHAQTMAVDPAVTSLRIGVLPNSDITLTGEDRTDIEAQLHVVARGYEPADAKAAADAVKLKLDRVGEAIVVSLDKDSMTRTPRRGPPAQLKLAIKLPRRLALRMEPHFGPLTASQLASAEIMGARGETRLTAIAGRLQLAHAGGPLEIDGVGSLKLNVRNSRGTIKHASGAFALDTTGGDLTLSDIVGPLEIESRNTDLRIDAARELKPPLRINATGGEIHVDGLHAEARIDGRNTDIEVGMSAAAPVTIYNFGEINVTAPPNGYTLDASATDGHLFLDDGAFKTGGDGESHAEGPVRGGGPTLALRATRGAIKLRKPEGK
jgi:hypothetical protein